MTRTLYSTLSSSLVQPDHSDSAYDLETAPMLGGDRTDDFWAGSRPLLQGGRARGNSTFRGDPCMTEGGNGTPSTPRARQDSSDRATPLVIETHRVPHVSVGACGGVLCSIVHDTTALRAARASGVGRLRGGCMRGHYADSRRSRRGGLFARSSAGVGAEGWRPQGGRPRNSERGAADGISNLSLRVSLRLELCCAWFGWRRLPRSRCSVLGRTEHKRPHWRWARRRPETIRVSSDSHVRYRMGRSQLKLKATGGEVFWFQCPCAYRWSGSTPAGKALAYKLHGRNCALIRDVQPLNREGPGVVQYKESVAIAAQRLVDQAREEERGLGSN